MADLTGEIIDDRYQLIRQIAGGGMAAIYLGLDLRLDRQVAVKIMHPHLASDEDFVARFIKEAKASATLNHPNVVSILDQGWNTNGAPAVYIVMEYVDGITLRDLLAQNGPLAIGELLRYILPILSALSEAHSRGIINRDIKPENIMLSKDGRIKLADFGLASGAALGATMTMESSVVLGSVSYLSPEQVERGIADARSDIYSVGITCFELLTGQKPYAGESPIQIAYRHVNERVPAVSTYRPEIPISLDSLISKATAPNPDQRYRDASEMLEAMREIAAEIDPTKRQLSLALDLPLNFSSQTNLSGRRTQRPRGPVTLGQSKLQPAAQASAQNQNSHNEWIPKEEVPMPTQAPSTLKTNKEGGRKKRAGRWMVALLVLALGGGGFYLYHQSSASVSVPSLVGLTLTQADTQLTPLGLHYQVAQSQFSQSIAKGVIIQSSPAGGGHIKKGGSISLIISKGQNLVALPDLSGLNQSDATAKLTALGLSVGNISYASTSAIPQGEISSTSPTAGSNVPAASSVDLIISKGGASIQVASYVGLSSDQATNELTNLGFKVASTFGYSESVAPGLVISQSPDPHSPITVGSTINLVISQGSASVVVPRVIGLTSAQAVIALENLQLRAHIVRARKSATLVSSQAPAAGSKAARDSVITIYLH